MSAFASMDLNGDGVVTQEEFCAAQRRMAAQHPGGRPAGGPEWLAAPPAVQAMRAVSRIEVQEKVNAIEAGAALLGQEVEMPNRYAVIDGATHQQVFFAVEQTGFVQRQLKQCFGDCTPWNLDIFYTGRGAPQKAFHVERPATCTCCCFNRPAAGVYDATSGRVLGSISDPCTCLSTYFTVRDESGRAVLSADGGCCQLGLWCPCPCGPCSRVDFDITDTQSGRTVGHIQKRVPSPLMWMFAPDVDNYAIDFGRVSNPNYKVLIMAMSIFMDFRYWNDNTRDNRNRGLPYLQVDQYARGAGDM